MKSITTVKAFKKLRIIFSKHRLPCKIVTENGSSFVEFKVFLRANGVMPSFTIPSFLNGLAREIV